MKESKNCFEFLASKFSVAGRNLQNILRAPSPWSRGGRGSRARFFTPKYTFILVSPCTSGNLSSSHTTIGLLGLNCTDRGHFFLQTIRFMNYVFISVTDDLLTPWTLLPTFPDVNFVRSKFHTWLLNVLRFFVLVLIIIITNFYFGLCISF